MQNNTNDQKNEWAKRDIGALWKREGSTQKYLSGYVKIDELGIERELKIVVFSNKNKNNNEKAPDYRIYVSKPKEDAKQPVAVEKKENKTTAPKASESTKKVKQLVSSEEEDLL